MIFGVLNLEKIWLSFLLSLSVLSDVFGAVDKTSSSFSAHGKIGNFFFFLTSTTGPSGLPGEPGDEEELSWQ